MNDLSPEARALIEDARPAERPDMSAKNRIRAALAAQLSMPPGPPPQPRIPPAVSAAGAGVATKLVLVCALTTTAVIGGVGVQHWISSSRAPRSAGQSPPRPAARFPDPSAATEARSLPTGGNTVPMIKAQGDALPSSASVDRATTPVLHRASNQNATVARPSSPQRPREQSGPAEHFAPAQNDLPGATSFLPSASPVRTTEMKAAATHPTAAAPGTGSAAGPLPARSKKAGCSAKEELRLLGAAQIALREGRAKLALATLDQHTALCPSARFSEEHSTAHILALCLLHQREQALLEATQLATLAPMSPQLARLRTSCAAAGVEKAARDRAAE